MSTPVYVTKFGNIQGINAGVEAYVNQQIKTAVEPLITGVNMSTVDAVPRYIDNTGKKVESTPVTIENIATLYVPGGINIGDRLAMSDYYLPGNRGTVGQVITMLNANSSTWVDAPPATLPTYTNELTVNTLAQGTTSLNKNYIFPTSAPSIDNTRYALTAINIGSSSPAYIDVTQLSTFSFLVTAVNPSDSYTISFTIGIGKYGVSDFVDFVVTGIRSRQQNFPAVTYSVELIFSGSTFSINIPATTPTPINFVSFAVAPISPSNLGNGLLGGNVSSSTTFTIGTQSFPNPAPTYVPSPPPARNLEWYPTNLTQSSISSGSNTSSIQCNEVGDISVNGSLNMGSANINNVNSLTSTDSTITMSCGQSQIQLASVADGLSPSNVTYLGSTDGVSDASFSSTVDTALIVRNSIPRLIVDENVTIRSSLFPATGGSGLKLSDDGNIELASYNGLLGSFNLFASDPKINITGPGGQSQLNLFTDTIDIYNTNGAFATTLREQITPTQQQFMSPDTSTKLTISNTGVRVSNAYNLPNADGSNGQVLTTDGAGQASWVTKSDGLFSQTGTRTVIGIVETSLLQTIGSVGSLSIPANYLTLGKSLLFKTGGSFRDNANNTLIRFRFKANGINLLDTGNIALTNVNTVRAWNIEIQTTYNGVGMVSNFVFRYTTPNITGQAFHFQTTTPINATIINTLDLTVNWTVLSLNNTITSNYATLTKIY
jgi:hypothetical protein